MHPVQPQAGLNLSEQGTCLQVDGVGPGGLTDLFHKLTMFSWSVVASQARTYPTLLASPPTLAAVISSFLLLLSPGLCSFETHADKG